MGNFVWKDLAFNLMWEICEWREVLCHVQNINYVNPRSCIIFFFVPKHHLVVVTSLLFFSGLNLLTSHSSFRNKITFWKYLLKNITPLFSSSFFLYPGTMVQRLSRFFSKRLKKLLFFIIVYFTQRSEKSEVCSTPFKI